VLESINQYWKKCFWSQETWKICQHYGIFSDLFEEGFFYPIIPLNVTFDYDKELVIPVSRGNVIDPSEVGLVYILY